ncbi:hypothetical protein IMCC26134_05105 [Verrucomicrobia bacterium IMCC26134]|nr:hypothetical protein IMCC26134_05105 [Verrucomicrobia bacterium IMCC26134]
MSHSRRFFPATLTLARLSLALLLPLTSVAVPLPTAVSPQGTLLRGGAEIFPFGIYHTSWIGERYGDERAQDLLAIHDNGLRILMTTLDPTSRQSDFTLLDDAARRDMGVMAELYLPALGLLIDQMKSYPAIISWQIGDDFNVTSSENYCSPELLKERHELARAHDPNHVTYASGGSAPVARYRSFKDYQGCINMIGIQCYPVDNKPDFPDELMLELCFQQLQSRVGEIEGSGIVPIANLQSFSWSKKGIFPTPSESRNMLYGALAAGVKGVLYYTFYDGTPINGHVTLNQQNPALWDEIRKQSKEINQLAPFLLKGTRRALTSNAEHVHVFMWENDSKKILVVFSTDRSVARDLRAEIPNSAGETLSTLFANRPAGLELKDGILNGRISPEEVHVYSVSESAQLRPLEQ